MSKQRTASRWRIAAIVCMIIAAIASTGLLSLTVINSMQAGSSTKTHTQLVNMMAATQRADEWRAAETYNQKLAVSRQPVMGTQSTDIGDGAWDAEYAGLLDEPSDGIIGSVEYPRLGIQLPIRHGTSHDTLQNGAGHMYGTSLPVGGASTHTIITAHTGLPGKPMFDRLNGLGDKAQTGDEFYLHVLGQTLAYRVTSIQTITPEDFSQLTISPGEDKASLLTCTPYGLNTHRLLVTGRRIPLPYPLQSVETNRNILFPAIGIAAIWLSIIGIMVHAHRKGLAQ